jgi:hypothetical protein
MSGHKVPFSIAGVPLLGLGVLLLSLGRPQITLPTAALPQQTPCLLDPSPRLDKALTIFLRQEAKDVAQCRKLNRPQALARTIDDYNLIARECTPAVFRATKLPSAM